MSIHTDERQYGTDEERAEWMGELRDEYARQEAADLAAEYARDEEEPDE